MRIEYYYDPHMKIWCAEVIDAENNVITFEYAGKESDIQFLIDNSLSNQYKVISIKKVKFYKC